MKCKSCGKDFKFSPFYTFDGLCSKCEVQIDPEGYDEETAFELQIIRNTGGRVPAVFDKDDNSFGF